MDQDPNDLLAGLFDDTPQQAADALLDTLLEDAPAVFFGIDEATAVAEAETDLSTLLAQQDGVQLQPNPVASTAHKRQRPYQPRAAARVREPKAAVQDTAGPMAVDDTDVQADDDMQPPYHQPDAPVDGSGQHPEPVAEPVPEQVTADWLQREAEQEEALGDALLQELAEAAVEHAQPEPVGDPAGRQPKETPWSQRQRQQHCLWATERPNLLEQAVSLMAGPQQGPCSICHEHSASCGVVMLRCLDCHPEAAPAPCCSACDKMCHANAHFHRRQAWLNGCWEPVPPSTEYDSSGQCSTSGKGFTIPPSRCDKCHLKGTFHNPCGSRPLTWVLHGRHDFVAFKYRCGNDDCRHEQTQCYREFMQAGGFPATLGDTQTVIDQQLLRRWERSMHRSPGSSLTPFLQGLCDESFEYGGLGQGIDGTTFRRAYDEYRYMDTDMRLHVMQIRDLDCPSCLPTTHSVHIDADMKLYIWDRDYQHWRQPYYNELLFEDDAAVLEHIKHLDLALGKEVADCTCKGLWKAAKDSSKRFAKMYYTGRCVATCRHIIPQCAVNLIKTGERYGYGHLLLVKRIYKHDVRQVHMDIMCKFADWENKVKDKVLSSTNPDVVSSLARCMIAETQQAAGSAIKVLPEMHARLHTTWCQLLWSPLYTVGAGAGSGEDSELFFAYWSSLNNTTRNMGAVSSTDALTHAAISWGRDKRERQAAQLADRYQRTSANLEDAEKVLAQLCAQHLSAEVVPGGGMIAEACVRRLHQIGQDLVRLAKGELARDPNAAKTAVELFKVVQRLKDAKILKQWLDLAEPHLRILAAENGDLARMQTVVEGFVQDLPTLERSQTDLHAKLLRSDARLTGLTVEAVAQRSLAEVAEEHLVHLQKVMEGHVGQVLMIRAKILSEAVGSKQISQHNRRIADEAKKIKDLVKEYNMLLPYGAERTPARVVLTADQLLAEGFSTFPWAEEYATDQYPGLRGLGVRISLQLHESHNKVQRYKEELLILHREVRQHIIYLDGKHDKVSRILAAVTTALAANPPVIDDQLSETLVCMSQAGTYTLSRQALNKDGVLAGCSALLSRAKVYYEQLQALAQRHLNHINNMHHPES